MPLQVRDYIDALDGSIHRERQHSHSQGHVVSPSSLGYAVDGICDGLSDFFRLFAFMILLQRYSSNNNRWAVLNNFGHPGQFFFVFL